MDEDLILKYQTLLEIEKRRLMKNIEIVSTETNLNSTDTDDKDNVAIAGSQKKFTSFFSENDSQEISTIVSKQEISTDATTNIPKAIKCESNAKARAATMDQWVTDSFYTSFPSFKKQDLASNSLADDRREEYKKYLAEVSNKKLLDDAKSRKRAELIDSETVFSHEARKQIFSTRSKMLDDLKHSELTYNFHNQDAIQDRNEKIAVERTRRKIELQQELVRQIEEKKLEIEKIRAKEKEDDEILQRRLENQIKSLQLAEELHKQNTEKMLVANPTYKTNSEGDVVSPFDKKVDTNKSVSQVSGRCFSENGTKNVNANNDRQIYKFFTNSAPHNESNVNHYNTHHPVRFDNNSRLEPDVHHISTTIHHSTEQCHHCRRPVPILCGSCQNNFNRPYECCGRCNLFQNVDVCNNCRQPWVRAYHQNRGGPHFDSNNTYQRNNRPQILEITYQDHSSQYNYKDDVVQSTQNYGQSETHHMTTKTLKNSSSKAKHSSPTNFGVETHQEMLSQSKDDEILELKRKNDILIAKHARNYGSLRKRTPISYEFETNRQSLDDSFPLPLMRVPLTTTVSSKTDKYKSRENSQAHKKLEYKWEIPVVQRQIITNNPSKVLTQVGAIAKQLQLEKLNFGNIDM